MNGATGPVVVGLDGNGQAATAARWAVREAALWHTSLTVLTASAVARPCPGGKASAWLETKAVLAQEVARAARDGPAAAEPGVPVMTKTSTAGAETALRQASAGALVLVLGPPTGTLSGLLAGSPGADLIARAGCPVVIVRGTGAARPDGPVVVGVDRGPTSEAAVSWAFEEASRRGTRLVAVHAWHDSESGRPFADDPASPLAEIGDGEKRLLTQRLAGRRERYPDVDVEPVVERDLPGDRLLERNAEAALVGSRRRGGFTGTVLGSTTHALLHRADCPVMAVGG
ncbi:universal stress protein [Amycolatopsis sp. NPDC049253]|uniref:universal stress protein n=1 Tax=Amycolatopsis sp. NPDC049253 TaxID=3155274 RepID=UPI003448FB3A